MGMAAITRRLESLVRPIAGGAPAESEADADDTDGEVTLSGSDYFAPNPGTA